MKAMSNADLYTLYLRVFTKTRADEFDVNDLFERDETNSMLPPREASAVALGVAHGSVEMLPWPFGDVQSKIAEMVAGLS